jgi:hypothetical protein
LKKTVKRYIFARKKLINCRQKQFVLTCVRCPAYDKGCRTYDRYVEHWMRLQALIRE